MLTIQRTRIARYAALASIPIAIGLLAACSSTAAPKSENGAAPNSPAAASGSFEDYQLKLASCMREQGIDMPDPSSDGSVSLNLGSNSQDAVTAASQVCRTKLGNPPAYSGSDPAQVQKEQLQYAQCLRKHGVNAPDPKPGEAYSIPNASSEIARACSAQGSSSGGSKG